MWKESVKHRKYLAVQAATMEKEAELMVQVEDFHMDCFFCFLTTVKSITFTQKYDDNKISTWNIYWLRFSSCTCAAWYAEYF